MLTGWLAVCGRVWLLQMVQRHQLMKYQYLMEFLYSTSPDVGEEVRGTYVETMGKTVFNLFRAYHAQLQKLVLEVRLARRAGTTQAEGWRSEWVGPGSAAAELSARWALVVGGLWCVQVANKNDLIAVEEGAVKSLFSTKVDLSKRGDAFSLADRDKILDNIEAEPILVHIAIAENQR